MTLQDIQNLGIVGAGGAGFPMHVKLESKPEFLILNAAECEPLLHKDKELLLNFTDEIISGMQTALNLTQAQKGIIGIKEKYPDLIQCISQKLPPRIEIIPIGDFYPAGDEVTLVYLTTGRIIQPGQLPISEGCVVQNVETILNLAQNVPVVDKYLTVAGEVTQPLTIKVPVGTSYSDVLSHFETTAPQVKIRSGGMMMGTLETDLNQVVTKTTGGLILLPADHACVNIYERYAEPQQTVRMAKASCDQCNFCTELCPRYLLGHPVRPETAMRNRMFTNPDDDVFSKGNAFCCECNLCTLYACPEGLDPKGSTVIEKRLAMQSDNKWEGLPVKAHPMMDYRKVPTKKLMQRLDVLKYKNEGPLSDLKIEPKEVRIPLKQHIGSPAKAVVQKGDTVKRLDLIAEASGNVSVPVHSSIDGRVVSVDEKQIVIQR